MALSCGVLCGLLFGEYTAELKLFGDAYVGLLQMTVLPYILFSLIGNIGKLNRSQATVLMRSGLKILLILWALAGLLLVVMTLALANIESGSFFSASLVQPAPNIDLLALFIPANLFRALADNAVPAVVVFCLMFGAALMENARKGALLPQLRIGVQDGSYFAARAQEHFPGVQFVTLASERVFFASPGLDALLTTAEGGAAWTLAYPAFTAINPLDSIERAP